jgi:hypothetical protein
MLVKQGAFLRGDILHIVATKTLYIERQQQDKE